MTVGNDEGSQVTELTDEEKASGSVSQTRYVGVKEMLGKREATLATTQTELEQTKTQLTTKAAEVKNLGEQLEQAKQSVVDPVKQKALETAQEELALMKLDSYLKEHNITAEEIKDMTEEQVHAYVKGKGQGKPAPDVGLGSGGVVSGTARGLIRSGFDSLHPSDK